MGNPAATACHKEGREPGNDVPAGWQVLLVCRSSAWQIAVQAALSGVARSRLVSCSAQEALLALAGGDEFSHLLAEPDEADGLLEVFADLTGAHASSRTSLLSLGGAPSPGSNTIEVPDPASIRHALMAAASVPHSASSSHVMNAWIPAETLLPAVRSSMLEARYQPIVRLVDGVPVSLEALARLHHPVFGTVLPDHFVPQFEAAGLGRELTQAVSARVFSDLGTKQLFGRQLSVAVNFPLNVLTEPAALTVMDEQRVAAEVPAANVIVELTESQPVEDLPRLMRSLEWLRGKGYRVSIDDVGPATPTARELFDLPFTGMKLDKSVVQGSMDDLDTMVFLQAMVGAAKDRGLSIVAEGITSQFLWDRMLTVGVDHGQGFLIAKPLPVRAISAWLQAFRRT